MGRAATIMSMAMTILIPIGQLFFGFLYDVMDPNYIFVISAALLLTDIFIHRKALLKYGDEESALKENGFQIDSN